MIRTSTSKGGFSCLSPPVDEFVDRNEVIIDEPIELPCPSESPDCVLPSEFMSFS